MRPTYDLWTESWIPCAQPGAAAPRLVSMKTALTEAHNLPDIAVQSPPVAAALYRLLLAVLYRSLRGPRDIKEWQSWWRAGRFDAARLEKYRGGVAGRFNLFHPVFPFMQTGNLPAQIRPRSVLTLAHQHTDFGANAQMFGGRIGPDSSVSPGHAALLVVAHQPFALGGLISRLPGESPSAPGGPLAKAAVIVAKGRTLFETLLLNMVPYEGGEEDRPAWERGGTGIGERQPDGMVDYLTWQSRRICLLPPEFADGRVSVHHVQIAGGWYPPPALVQQRWEPMVAFRAIKKDKKDVWFPVGISEERALWRDLTPLLVTATQNLPPRNLRWLAELWRYGVGTEPLVLEALGLATFQYKILRWRRERCVLPASCLYDPWLVEVISGAVGEATAVAQALRFRVGQLQPGHTVDVMDYWASLAEPFREWLAELGNVDDPTSSWRKVVRRLAWRSFYGHMGRSSASLLAQAQCEARFGGALVAALTDKKREREEESDA